MAESDDHLILKQAAIEWAIAQGYRAVSTEVRLPNSSFRADVAGCRLERPEPRHLKIESTAAFECKQARSDFLKDSFQESGSDERLRLLHRRKEKLERLIGSHYPTLRRGDSLFPEYERSDPLVIRHGGYRKLKSEISTLEKGLFTRTKFDKMIRYRCVDLCYLVIRKGIAEPHEIPSGWGLLECDLDANGEAHLTRLPQWNEAAEHHRLELLHLLAVKGSPKFEDEGDFL